MREGWQQLIIIIQVIAASANCRVRSGNSLILVDISASLIACWRHSPIASHRPVSLAALYLTLDYLIKNFCFVLGWLWYSNKALSLCKLTKRSERPSFRFREKEVSCWESWQGRRYTVAARNEILLINLQTVVANFEINRDRSCWSSHRSHLQRLAKLSAEFESVEMNEGEKTASTEPRHSAQIIPPGSVGKKL